MTSCYRTTPIAALLAAMTLGLASPAAHADIVFSGSSGGLSASVSFAVSGTDLLVTLTNTSLADVDVPGQVLTAFFFDLAGVPTLTRISAVLASGSFVVYDTPPAGGIVGGEWAYKDGLAGLGGATEGISSTGLGLFGSGDLFPGPDLESPLSPDGVEYGLLSAGYSTLNDNGGLTGSGGLIKNSVVFTLSGLPSGFSLDAGDITHVFFQYGTALTDTRIPGGPCTVDCGGGPGGLLPEPGSLALLGLGLSGLAAIRRRRPV